MYTSAQIRKNTDAVAVITVEIAYNPGESFLENGHVYMVTIDKIIGTVIVHHEGETRRTRLELSDYDDKAVLEEGAILAAIHFPAGE